MMNDIQGLRLALILLLLVACRPQTNSSTLAPGDQPGQESYKQNKQWIEIPVTVNSPSTGLGLTQSLEAATLDLQGCVSGHSDSFDLAANHIPVYRHDQDCVIILSQITWDGQVFQPTDGFDPNPGQLNIFTSSQDRRLTVLVESQLSSPIQLNDQVGFLITEHQQGSDEAVTLDRHVVIPEALQASVAELDGSLGFRIRQLGQSSDDALTVYYQLSGDAQPGDDYVEPAGQITIPEGQNQVQLDISLVNDAYAEGAEFLQLAISDSPNYDHYGTARVLITDSDVNLSPTNQLLWLASDSINWIDFIWFGRWQDESPNGYDATYASSNARPQMSNDANLSLNYFQFDGSNDRLDIANNEDFNTAGPYDHRALFALIKTPSDLQGRQIIYEEGGTTRGLSLYLDSNQLMVNGWNDNNDDNNQTTPWTPKHVAMDIEPDTFYVVSLVFDAPNSAIHGYLNGQWRGSVNGVGRLFTHTDAIGLGGPNGGTRFHDGSTDTTDTFFSGGIAEFIAYGGGQTSADIAAVNGYLLNKLGIDDTFVNLYADQQTVAEDAGLPATYSVVLNQPLGEDLTLNYTVSGEAMAGEDFQAPSGQIEIPAQSTTAQIQIPILDDTAAEGPESIVVTLAEPTQVSLMQGTASVTLLDDETFNPGTGLVMWLDANQGTQLTSSQRVTAWDDLSSYGQQVSQAQNAQRPSWSATALNGQPAVLFDGQNDLLEVANDQSINTAGPYTEKTLAIAFQTGGDVLTRQLLYEEGANVRGLNLYIDDGYLYVNAWNFNDDDNGMTTPWGQTFVATPVQNSQAYVATLTYDYAEDRLDLQLNQNSIEVTAGVGKLFAHSGAIGIGAINNTTVLHDGSTINSGMNFAGHIAELLLYNEALSGARRQNLQSYLMDRYLP
jgi:hypothetical protein